MNELKIVMYHYVREISNSQYSGIKGLERNLFIEQINYMLANYNIIKIEDVIESIDNQRPLPENSILLTFDDGYADHYEVVYPILMKYNIKGTFFVPAKTIKESVVLDVNKIHYILALTKDIKDLVKELKTQIGIYSKDYCLEPFDDYYTRLAIPNRWDDGDTIFVKRILQRELPIIVRSKMLNNIFEKIVGVNESEFSKELYMNTDQMKEMLSDGQHIGSHAYNHYWLGYETYDEQYSELSKSLEFLKSIGVSSDKWTIGYPQGSYNDNTLTILKQLNCRLGICTRVDTVKGQLKECDRYILPRIDTNDVTSEMIKK